ncbi:MAG: DUF885 domain-containing protein [Vulcanimicrobiaceae bacterium]
MNLTRSITVVLMTMLLGTSAVPARTSSDAEFYAAAQKYYNWTFKMDPAGATDTGVHAYDSQLGSYDADAYAARIAMTRDMLSALKHIDRTKLSTEAGYDYQIFESSLRGTLLDLDTDKSWRHHPGLYTGIAAGAIYALIKRNFAPLDVRMRDAIAREQQIPKMLHDAAANITTVDATTALIESADVKGSSEFFSQTVPQAFVDVKDAALQAQLAKANDATIAAIRAYSAALDAGPFAHPSGTFAIGAQEYQTRLALQELGSIPLKQYERAGVAALGAYKAQFIALAKKIDPTKTPQAVMNQISDEHAAPDQLLPDAQRVLTQLRAFVVSHHLLTLPETFDIKVVPTPVFARQTTFASMDSPGPLEQRATQAYYNVTPVESTWSPARVASHLGFLNIYNLPLISAHEVMPGHYLNYIVDKGEALSIVRKLTWSVSFGEGWAHYDEQMMVDEGWGGGNPKVRMAQLQSALLRASRYVVGVREHTEGMTVEQATKFFEDNAFTGVEPAHREALRGTQDPMYGYYTLGKLELLKLRADYKKKMGAAYSLQKFHDALLAHGDPPMSIARKELLGSADDGKLL